MDPHRPARGRRARAAERDRGGHRRGAGAAARRVGGFEVLDTSNRRQRTAVFEIGVFVAEDGTTRTEFEAH